MTDEVVSLRPDVELGEFFDYIYGSVAGYVYAPLKGREEKKEDDTWETHFFEWPRQRPELIDHVLTNTATKECYYGPALYRELDTVAKTENILGSNVVWAEFDGNSQSVTFGDKIPHPSMRLQSSLEGHEHLYWKLDDFETDREKFEGINRAIAYTLQADTSGWDSTQILRPPGTKNHKRNKFARIITQSAFTYDVDFFSGVPVPKQLVTDTIDLDNLPDVFAIIAKYPWSDEEFAFFRKQEIKEGSRSSALMRLAYTCAEMRMSDEEIFVFMYNADERWGKFRGRRDQTRRLLEMINRARLKYPIDPESSIDGFQAFNWQEILDLEVHIEWMIPGILQRQGLMLLSGPPGVGKTQLSLQFLMSMAIGKPLFDWQIDKPRKVTFFSMEMGQAELKYIIQQMNEILTDEERVLLSQNFSAVPIGYGVLMDTETDQKKINKYLAENKPDLICFDSLSVTTSDELSDERTAKKIMDFANHMRMDHDVAVMFIHHNRKAQSTNKKPNSLSDVYGSNFLTSQPTTVLGMWSDLRTEDIQVMFLKVRLAEEPKTLTIQRTKGLSFRKVEPSALISQATQLMKDTTNAANPPGKQSPLAGPAQTGFS